MLRTYMRHLFAALFTALIVGSAAGGLEAFFLYQSMREHNPPPSMILLHAITYAAFWLFLGAAAGLIGGSGSLFRGSSVPGSLEPGGSSEPGTLEPRKSEPGTVRISGGVKNALFGSYFVACLTAYGVVFSGGFLYEQYGLDVLTLGGLLTGAGLAAALIAAAFVLGKLILRMDRRGRGFKLAVVGIWIALSIFLGLSSLESGAVEKSRPPTRGPTPDRPNTLFLLVDTLRADHLGCYGYERPTSAAVDALAADGVRFERCIAQGPWTMPSVASILTSTVPPFHQVVEKDSALGTDFQVFPDDMADYGYLTASITASKWISQAFGFSMNVDFYRSSTRGLSQETGLFRTRVGQTTELLWKVVHLEPAKRILVTVFYRSHKLLARIGIGKASDLKNIGEDAASLNRALLGWLDTVGETRFAAYVHYMEPHTPYDPDPPFDTLFERDYSGEPMTGPPRIATVDKIMTRSPPIEQGALDDMVARYDGEIAQFSHEFGNLVAELKARRLYDDMLIVLVSDHGDEFYDHESWEHGHSVYGELIRVPLIIKLPQNRHARTVVNAHCSTVDILPTVFDLFGVPPWKQAEGASLMPFIRGEATEAAPGWNTISCTEKYGAYIRSYIDKRHKVLHVFQDGTDSWLLFDLEADPAESRDIAAERPDLLAEMRQKLEDYYSRYGSLAGKGRRINVDPEMEEKLKQLGY